jgi:hypothetical protein
MFLIASTGRSGTVAVTEGLNAHSDHEVGHEPEPLLREAWLKHHRRPYWTKAYRTRMAFYRDKVGSGARYGESFRTPNLVTDVLHRAPGSPLLVMVRDPEGYVLSAHARQVLSKDDQWDRYRLLPRRIDPSTPLAVKIALHWQTVNGYLLRAVDRHRPSRVVLFQPLDPVIDSWADFLGAGITDREGLRSYLTSHPNRSTSHDEPEGFDQVAARCRPMWDEIQERAGRPS